MLKQQLVDAQNSASSEEAISEAVKKATDALQTSFEAQIPRIKTEGAGEWGDTDDYVGAMKEHNGLYFFATGCSWVCGELKHKQSLDLNDYHINGPERMTTNGITLFRKKKFPYPINLSNTPSDMLEDHVIEYEYKDSRPGDDELEGLPKDFYAHLAVKHKKIKACQLRRAPLNPTDPDLTFKSSTRPDAHNTPNEVPSTPSSTNASVSEESSDAGLSTEDEGEEVDSKGRTGQETVAEEDVAAEEIAFEVL